MNEEQPMNEEQLCEFECSPELHQLGEALAKAQADMGAAKKNEENTFYKNSYADLGSVIEASKAIHKHGLSVTQITVGSGAVITMLLHESGEWIRGRMELAPVKDDPQGRGSSITYTRRYALQALLNIPAADDDGNEATHPPKPEPKPKRKRAPKKEPKPKPSSPIEKINANETPKERLNRLKVNDWAEGVEFDPELSSMKHVTKFLGLSDEDVLAIAEKWRSEQ